MQIFLPLLQPGNTGGFSAFAGSGSPFAFSPPFKAAVPVWADETQRDSGSLNTLQADNSGKTTSTLQDMFTEKESQENGHALKAKVSPPPQPSPPSEY